MWHMLLSMTRVSNYPLPYERFMTTELNYFRKQSRYIFQLNTCVTLMISPNRFGTTSLQEQHTIYFFSFYTVLLWEIVTPYQHDVRHNTQCHYEKELILLHICYVPKAITKITSKWLERKPKYYTWTRIAITKT